MRTEADNLVIAGEMTQEQADRYKCNPQAAIADTNASGNVKIDVTNLDSPREVPSDDVEEGADEAGDTDGAVGGLAALKKKKKKCLDKIGLTYEVGTPVALIAHQTIEWCYDGTKVSDWSGVCEGSVTTWGKAIFWSFDSCSQNDWIAYKIGNRKNGGIHHKTRMNFVNKTPWTFDQSFLLEQWGHYDGGLDQMVDGKLVGLSKGK